MVYKHPLLHIPFSSKETLLYAPTLGKVWSIASDDDLGWKYISSNTPKEAHKPHLDLTLLISYRCNLRCVYCYQDHNTKEVMKLGEAKRICDVLLEKHEDEVDRVVINYGHYAFSGLILIKSLVDSSKEI